MMTDLTLPWIQIGYEIFSQEGPQGLKVEVMARGVQKSKSSFYHHFADMEGFTEQLLTYHLKRSAIIAEQEQQCPRVIPDLLLLLLDVKEDLLFSRQLRIHRNVPAFKACFERASQEVGEAIGDIWAEALGLTDNSYLAMIVLNLSLENFYLQLTPETLTYEWLLTYIQGLQRMVREFKNNAKRLPHDEQLPSHPS